MRKTIRASLGLLRPAKRRIFFLIVAARMLLNFLDVVGLAATGLLGAMVASGLTNRPDATFLGINISIESSQAYFWIVGAIATFFISKSLLAAILLRYTGIFLAKQETLIATEVVNYIFAGSLSHLREFSRGDIQWAASQSSTQAVRGILMSFSAMLTEGALFIGIFVMFILVDSTTAFMVSLYFILLVVAFQLFISRRLRAIGIRIRDRSIRITNTLFDLSTAFREITTLQKRKNYTSNFSSLRRQNALDEALQSFLSGLPRYFVEAALMIGILALIGWQFAQDRLSDGLVIVAVFLAGGVRMMGALLPLQSAIANIRVNGPQAERAQELVRRARSEKNATTGEEEDNALFIASPDKTDGPVGVVMENIRFRHRDADADLFENISLNIPPGSFAAFIGPSGAGKTSLVDLILGLENPVSGTVQVNGLPPIQFRQQHPGVMSYVPQSPSVVNGSVAQNVALGEPKDKIDVNRVWEVLEIAQLAEFVRSLPEGVDSTLGQQLDSLSGGQKQRLGLARALYSDPRIIILDESTSALDAGLEDSITRRLRSLRGHTTLIVIAHRLSTVKTADVVFVVEEGKIVADGTFSEVRKQVPMIEEHVRLMSIESGDDDAP